MATTTKTVLRQRLSEKLGDYFASTTTGAGGTTSAVDASLPNHELGVNDDGFNELYILSTTAGNGLGQFRRILDYVASTVTISWTQAMSAAVGSGGTYEIHRINPSLKHQALAMAIRELFPQGSQRGLWLPLRNETLIVDNLLSNSDFETFSGGFTGWTEVGSPTVTQDTTRYMHGASSAKVIAGGSAGQQTQTIDASSGASALNLKELAGRSVTVKMWAWASAASAARLRLDWDGSDIDNGAYHAGNQEWELLEVTGTVPDAATQVKVIQETAANQTAWWDLGWAYVNGHHLYRYTIPTAFLRGPQQVWVQAEIHRPDGVYVPYHYGVGLAPGTILRLQGMGALTTFTDATAETATMELGQPQVELVAAYAAYCFYRSLAQAQGQQARIRFGELAAQFRAEAENLRRFGMLPPGAYNGPWRIGEDVNGRYLDLLAR